MDDLNRNTRVKTPRRSCEESGPARQIGLHLLISARSCDLQRL